MHRTDCSHCAALAARWREGHDDAPEAIERTLALEPTHPRPAFLTGPCQTTLHPWLAPESLAEVLPLLRDAYWNAGRFDDEALLRAHRHSGAWVAARDATQTLVATARAVTDRVKFAYIGDVAVAPAYRASGLGTALMTLLLAHPALRTVRRVELATRDAETFYRPLGFETLFVDRRGPYPRYSMARMHAR